MFCLGWLRKFLAIRPFGQGAGPYKMTLLPMRVCVKVVDSKSRPSVVDGTTGESGIQSRNILHAILARHWHDKLRSCTSLPGGPVRETCG